MSNASIIQTIVLNTARELAAGRSLPRVTLAELRAELDGVTRAAQDAALGALEDAGKLVLMRNDNTPALTAADHAAALMTGAGNPRHLAWLVG